MRQHKVSKLEKKVKDIVLKQQTKIEERKFYDISTHQHLIPQNPSGYYTQNGVVLVNSSLITPLLTIAQGTDIVNRIGNEIKVLSVNYKSNVVDWGTAFTARTFLVQDTQQISDTPPVISDIFSNWDPNNYLLNISNNKRFKILERSPLRTNVFMRTAGTVYGGGEITQEMNLFHKFKFPLKVRYNGTTANDYQKNMLYVITLTNNSNSDVAVASTDMKYIEFCRSKYIDG